MTKNATITIQITSALADALQAVARGSGGDAPKLAGWIVSEWVGRLPADHTPAHSLAIAHRRLTVLQSWWEARKAHAANAEAAIGQVIAHARREGMKASRAALYEWQQRWEAGGLAGLIDRRKRPLKAVQDPFTDRVKELYRAVRGRRLTTCYREARREFSAKRLKLPSYHTVCRRVRGKRKTA